MGEKNIDKEKLVTILEKSGIKKLNKLSEKCNLNKIADDTINVIKNEDTVSVRQLAETLNGYGLSLKGYSIFLDYINTMYFTNKELESFIKESSNKLFTIIEKSDIDDIDKLAQSCDILKMIDDMKNKSEKNNIKGKAIFGGLATVLSTAVIAGTTILGMRISDNNAKIRVKEIDFEKVRERNQSIRSAFEAISSIAKIFSR